MQRVIASGLAAALLACAGGAPAPEQAADVIYRGGPIVTVNDAQPTAEALAVKDGRSSLEVGKLADLVILSDNPLTIDPAKINTIRVRETVKEGRTVWRRPS